MNDDKDYGELIRERFSKLPKVVQDAITSADVQKHLRELADTHKLHIDQWDKLENEVQLTLLGVQPSENLVNNITHEVGVPQGTAVALVNAISEIVFEPIRQELERQLEHPDAVAAATTGAEDVRTKMLADAKAETAAPAPVAVAPAAVAPPQAAVAPTPLPEIPVPAATVPPQPPTAPGAPVVPATVPAPAPLQKAVRASFSPLYTPSQPSHERKAIEGDPYREQVA